MISVKSQFDLLNLARVMRVYLATDIEKIQIVNSPLLPYRIKLFYNLDDLYLLKDSILNTKLDKDKEKKS